MGDLSPLASDIETSGLGPGSVITVAGIATEMGSWLALNTTGREADASRLTTAVEHESGLNVRLAVYHDESDLMEGLAAFAADRIDGDRHYLIAYNGERWRGGFDLPFLRSACVRQDVEWPFPDIAYADTMDMVEGFDTGDVNDLVGVYEVLIDALVGSPARTSNGKVIELVRICRRTPNSTEDPSPASWSGTYYG